MAPILHDFTDLVFLAQGRDIQNPENKTVTFGALDTDNVFYHGTLHGAKADVTLHLLRDALQRVPDNMVYPSIPEPSPGSYGHNGTRYFQRFTGHLSGNYFVKRPDLQLCSGSLDMKVLAMMKGRLLEEAKALEALSQAQRQHEVQPHPGIIAYHGCIIRRGFITGIVLDSLPTDLATYYETHLGPPLSRSTFMHALKSAVQHLHSLGLAHNNIHCRSVRVSASGLPVLSDFAWCYPAGRQLKFSARPPGWEETYDNKISKFRNDMDGLDKLNEWIATENQRFKDRKK